MHPDFQPHYTIKLTGPELRIVGLALAGKLKDDADLVQARALNECLVRGRELRLSEALEVAKGATKHTENQS